MRAVACALLLVIACGGDKPPVAEWKPRTGPGFEVTAPFAPTTAKNPVGPGMEMAIYEFDPAGKVSMQLTIGPMPKDRNPYAVVQQLRDKIAAMGTILAEDDVPVGDVMGKDLRFKANRPVIGSAAGRSRLMVQDGKIYQLTTLYAVNTPGAEADSDRFVDSFHFTGEAKKPNVRIVADKPEADGWYAAHSTSGFTVRAPGPITEQSFDDSGKHFEILSTVKQPEKIKFAATCMTTPREATERDVVGDGRGVQGRRERDVNGRKGVELDVDNNATFLAVFDGRRICIVGVNPYNVTTPRPVDDAKKFFDAFSLDP